MNIFHNSGAAASFFVVILQFSQKIRLPSGKRIFFFVYYFFITIFVGEGFNPL